MVEPRSFGREMTSAFGLVLLLVLAIFVAGSLLPYRGWSAVVLTSLCAVAATVALAAARARTQFVIWGGRLAALAVLLAVIDAIAGGRTLLGLVALLIALLLGGGALAVLRAVLTEDRVGFRTILGAVSVYITLGLLFSFVYVGVDRLESGAFFSGSPHLQTGDFIFFSITTLTTTGYGDLVAAGQPGRMVSNIEMLVGQIFLVTLIARLVSMWRPGQWLRQTGGIGLRHREEGQG